MLNSTFQAEAAEVKIDMLIDAIAAHVSAELS
jgi:hypothetical protein